MNPMLSPSTGVGGKDFGGKNREQHTTSYCADDRGCAHDTVRNGYVRCEVSIGECAYQTLDKSKAKKAT